MVRYQDEFITVVKAMVEARADVIDALCTKVDELLSERLEPSLEGEAEEIAGDDVAGAPKSMRWGEVL